MGRTNLAVRLFLAVAMLTLAAGGQALAGNTWDGGGADNNWSTNANWNGDVKPANDGTIAIHMAGAVRPTPNVDVAWNIAGLIFDLGSSPFTLSGATLTINGNVRNLDGDLQTINNPIILGASLYFDAFIGDLMFNSPTINNGGNTLNVYGTYNTTINGSISGNGGLTKLESGTLTLNGGGANSYAGTTTVQFGRLVLAKTAGAAIPGNLAITGGTVELSLSNQIAEAEGSSVSISGTGTLNLGNCTDTIHDLAMTGGTVQATSGTLGIGGAVTGNASAGLATIAATVNLTGATRTFTIADGGADPDMEISGIITNGGITKDGNGSLKFSGAATNTYSGTTTVSAGTLLLAKSAHDGAFSGDLSIGDGTGSDVVRYLAGDQIRSLAGTVTVNSSGTLDLNGFNDAIYNLTLAGGAVTLGAGSLSVTGTVTSTASATTATISGNLLGLNDSARIFDIADGGAAPDLDISAAISTGGVTKNGTGTLRFSGATANTYTDLTTVNAGVLELAKTGGMLAVPDDLSINGGTVRLAGANQISASQTTFVNTGGTLDLNGYAQTLATLYMTGGSVTTGAGALTVGGGSITTNASATAATVSGNLNLGGATRVFTVADGAASYDLDISAAISNSGITKIGPGTLRFSGSAANTYTGATTVNEGTLVLDKSVTDGAIAKDLVIGDGSGTDTVRLNRGNQISNSVGNTVTINSSGVLDINGQVENINNLTMTGGGQVIGTGGGELQVQGTVTTNASSASATISGAWLNLATAGQVPFVIADGGAAVDLDVSGVISSVGGGGMVKSGPGTMRLSGTGSNIFSGTTTVNEGVLLLYKTAGVDAIAHDLVIGDGAGGAGADVVQLKASHQINDASNVTITSSGLLDVNGLSEVIGPLTMTSGSITTGAGVLGLGGDVTTNAHASSATISGIVSLGAPDREFSVADGAAAYDLDLSAVLSGGGLIKTGNGTLRLSGSTPNTYAGTTTVNEGVLLLYKTAGVDAIAHDLVIGDGTGTDTVRLNQSNQISQASGNTVTINSSGVLDLNAHTEAIGNLTMTGGGQLIGSGLSYLYVLGTVTTNASSATATISCTGLLLDVAGQPFVIADGAAAVDLDVSGMLSSASGSEGLVKSGPGTMRLSGSSANSYTGMTTVNAGTLELAKSGGWTAVYGDLTINTGTVRYLANNQCHSLYTIVTIGSSGVLDLNGFIDALLDFNMTGGSVTTGAGTLYLGGAVTTNASAATATISGNLSLYNGTRTFIVADGAAAVDLDISAAVSQGSLTKTGAGTLRLDGAASNIYTGDTTVSQGTLELSKTGAALAIAGNLIINSGGTVKLAASNQIVGSQTTTINSGGTLDLGSSGNGIANLVMSGGTITGGSSSALNVWASPATIQAAPGPATISANVNLLVGATGPGTILKTGALTTLTLGADSTIGNATLDAGTLDTGAAILTIPLGGTYSQTGGTFTGTLRSQGTFSYSAGTFGGRLINEGTFSLAAFTAGNGVQNFSTITRTAGQSLTSNGAGLDNQGEIILAGGTLDGGGPITNGASISGYGTIGGSGGFTNGAIMTVTGGNLTISKTGTNANAGTIDIQSGRQLRLTGGNLSNASRIDLDGGVVAGTATLGNNAGGAVVGRGTISSPFANNGGMLRAEGGAINVTAAFASSGLIELVSGSGLAGGSITNTGAIQGAGSISNAITNNGRIEAISGTIVLGGAVTNAVGGTIAVSAGNRVFIGSGLAANAGIISLDGGTFDNNGAALVNSGQISGRGTLRTGGLTNNGGIGFSAGITDVYGDVTNPSGGRITVTGGATATFYDDVVHNAGATFQVSEGSAVVLFGLSGTGSFPGAGTVYIEGDLRPGLSPAEVAFGGDLALGGGATLVAELAGTAPGSQYDVVDVGGRLALGGTLDVDLLYGLRPQAGQTFDILNFDPANLVGEFGTIDLPDLGGGLAWDTSGLYTTGAIGVVPEPATLALVALGACALLRRRAAAQRPPKGSRA